MGSGPPRILEQCKRIARFNWLYRRV